MAYMIRYGTPKDLARYERKNTYRMGACLFAFAVALAAGIRVFLPEVFDAAVNAVIPWDDRTVQAFSGMVEQVQSGQPVGEAVESFCRSIIENAYLWN